jgi:hypothetical protein
MRAIGQIILWLFIGLIGSAFIGFIAITVINDRSLPMMKMSFGPSVNTGLWDRGYVSATGTWVLEAAVVRTISALVCTRHRIF